MDSGILLDNLLYPNSRCVNAAKADMEEGMVPVKAFKLQSNETRFIMLVSAENGNRPERLLVPIFKNVRAAKLEMDSGISPSNLFMEKSNIVNLRSDPIDDEIVPSIMFPDTSSASSSDGLGKLDGREPVNSFIPKYNFTSFPMFE